MPAEAELRVKVGDRVTGGSSVLGRISLQTFMPSQRMERSDGAGASQMQRPPAQRGMYVLPSLFTAGNIAIGYYIIMQSIRGSMLGDSAAFDHAAMGVAVAILFDGLDGRIARMTNTSSAFGRELDSLADVITFGVAPSLLAYLWGVRLVRTVRISDHSGAADSLRRGGLLSVPDLRSVPAGAVQYQRESATAQSGQAGPQVLCRNADSCRRRCACRGGAL